MRALSEPRRPQPEGQSFVAFRHEADSFPFLWHYHADLELTYIESGAGNRYVGDNIAPFGADDLVLLGENLPHTWASEANTGGASSHRAIVVHFRSPIVSLPLDEFGAIRNLLDNSRRGLCFKAPVARTMAPLLHGLVRAKGLDAWCQLVTVLDKLATVPAASLCSAGYVPQIGPGTQGRMDRVLRCIEQEACNEGLDLARVAKVAHMNPAAFSRFFHRMTGATLVEHINRVRVAKACRLLSESDMGVAELAYACGYGSLANFNRRFKELKRMSPREYRSRFLRKPLPVACT